MKQNGDEEGQFGVLGYVKWVGGFGEVSGR